MPKRHTSGTATQCNKSSIWTETSDHVLSLIGWFLWQSWTVQLYHTLTKPGLGAMSLLLALSLICGSMLHVSFSALNNHYCVPRKTVLYQSKSHTHNTSSLNLSLHLHPVLWQIYSWVFSSLRMNLNILTMIYEQTLLGFCACWDKLMKL